MSSNASEKCDCRLHCWRRKQIQLPATVVDSCVGGGAKCVCTSEGASVSKVSLVIRQIPPISIIQISGFRAPRPRSREAASIYRPGTSPNGGYSPGNFPLRASCTCLTRRQVANSATPDSPESLDLSYASQDNHCARNGSNKICQDRQPATIFYSA